MMRALVVAGCGALSVIVSACESTEQESARIGREGQRLIASGGSLRLGAVNHSAQVSEVTLLSGSEGRAAVALRLSSTSSRAQVGVPLLVSIAGPAGGKVLYTNAEVGLEGSLQHATLPATGSSSWWVDDQVPAAAHTGKVSVRIGSVPQSRTSRTRALVASGVHLEAQSGFGALSGVLHNPSSRAVGKAPVFAVAQRAGRIVAAGRAVVASLAAHASAPFQILLVGDATGARLEVSTPAVAG
jgi:hypothetical protein